MKTLRHLLGWGAACVAVWMILCVTAGVVATEAALHPARHTMRPMARPLAEALAARNHATLAEVAIDAKDGATLRGWSIRPARGNGDAVILLHGHTDNRAGMLGNAELLLRHGYSVLLPDARAHGASGGELATYGVKEADDVRLWLAWLRQTQSPRCIDGLGESMGASQLLASLRTEPGFCAVVAESPFASFREASYDRLGEMIHAGAGAGRTLLRPSVEAGFAYARWKYGVNFAQASPEDAVAASNVPVLLIHGLKDTNLPARNSERIAARNPQRNPPIVLWEPVNAQHCGASGSEPKEFERRVISWFESHGGGVPKRSLESKRDQPSAQ